MKSRSPGRGKHYHFFRSTMERVTKKICIRDWPARMWDLFPTALDIRVIYHTITPPQVNGSPCRIVFLSDLHIGPMTSIPLLEKAFSIVRDLHPQVVLFGGDYVFCGAPPTSLELLASLVKSIPCSAKFAVMGNHDLWTHDDHIAETLEWAGATVLVNQSRRLPDPWSNIAVVGLDDPWTGNCDGTNAFSLYGEDTAEIVLCHSPDGLLHINSRQFLIYLCGHTHSGQVATPRKALFIPSGSLSRHYNAGFYRFGNGQVFVSRGIGGVGVPVRINAPPDLLCLDLVNKRDIMVEELNT